MTSIVLLLAVAALVVVVGAAVAVGLLVASARRAQQPAYGFGGAASPPGPATTWGCVEAWQAAGASIEAVGLRKLDAETYWSKHDNGGQALYLSVDVKRGDVTGRLERPCPGGALESYAGARVEVRPGERGGAPLAQFVAGAVGELLAALPRAARLSVTAPEIPGDSFKLLLTTPLTAPEQPAAVARVLFALDQAARAPAPAGAHSVLSPIAARWMEAASSLEALGLKKLDAECYWHERSGISQALYLNLDVKHASVTGRLERPCPGGALEGFIGQSAEVRPGKPGHSDLARFVAAAVGEALGQLPREATLSVKAPEIPGDAFKLLLTTPFTAPAQAAAVVRVLFALDETARAASAAGAHARLSPVAALWLSAGPTLEALGLRKLDAECYWRGDNRLFVNLDVARVSVSGRLEGARRGGALERFIGQSVELCPGVPGRSELGAFVARAVWEVLGALPRTARLSVKAPQMAGDRFSVMLTTPFAVADHAAGVARVLLVLEVATR